MRAFQCAILAASFVLSSVALARSQEARGGDTSLATVTSGTPEGFVARGAIHRVLVRADDLLLGELLAGGTVLRSEDYGSFVFLQIMTRRPGELRALLDRGATLADEQTLVAFNGLVVDGADRAATAAMLASIPEDLRAPQGPFADGERRMRVVQLDGPVKDEWLATLEATGASLVSYVAHDSYVVVVDGAADAHLEALRGKPYLLSISEYEPAFKLRPELRDLELAAFHDVIVQVFADEAGRAFVPELLSRAAEVLVEPHDVLQYVNVGLRIDGANVHELARDARVFAIEPKLEARLFDEAQGQIMAANLTAAGSQPTGPGYLAWLQGLGFPGAGANPFSFSVDVHDDGVDRGSTTDVNVEFRVNGQAAGASRVAFSHNFTSDALADGRAGHGNINASIIGGYNDTAGSAFEDASGYQYGLGIAPWVRIGNSKVFANSGAGQFNQPTRTRMGNAYGAGARISSNSWGYTSGNNYNADTQAHDASVRDAQTGVAGNQELAIVIAAGNSGSGAGTVHPPGTGKNVLTVGASENFRQTGTDGCGTSNTGANDARDLIGFSGRGPTSDTRKKPDICAPGTHIEGAASRAAGYDGTGVCNPYWPIGQTLYAWSSGTSHSTPAVAGFCALIRQHFLNQGLAAPSPAMLKAVVLASGSHMTGVGANDTLPSNNQGYGLTNMARAFDGAARMRVDQGALLAATGATYTTSGTIASSVAPFRVALAWTDAPGATTGNAFVNNLDLEVTVNGTLYRGNVFSGASSVSGGGADVRNNTECVFLPAGASGPFSVTVRATNIAGDGVPGNGDATDQDFALLVYNGSAVAPAPDFALGATPASRQIVAGTNTSYSVSSTALNGFSGNVSLSASPAISGVTFAFTPNPILPNGSSTLNVTTGPAATTGSHLVTITGTSGALVRQTTVQLVIDPPAAPSFALAATPSSRTISAGGNTSYLVSSTALNGFSGNVTLSASPAIAGVTFGFTANPIASNGSATLNVTTSSGATPGTHGVTITGTSGALVRQAQVQLTIDPVGGGNPVRTFTASPNLPIPDNNATGASSTIHVADALTVSSIAVSTTIPHTYKGDLVVALIGPDSTTVLLHNRTGGSTDNVSTTFSIVTASAQALSAFQGKSTLGAWRLRVQDLAAADLGTLSSWQITFNGERSAAPNLAIPDNNATGVTSTLNLAETGTVAGVRVRVHVPHTYKGDLEIALIGPDNTTVLLHDRTGGSTDNVSTEYPDLTAPAQSLNAFTGKSIQGAWRLRVRDLAGADVGTLSSWTLSLRAP